MPDFPPKARIDSTIIERNELVYIDVERTVETQDAFKFRVVSSFTGVSPVSIEMPYPTHEESIGPGVDTNLSLMGLSYETEVA